jgi:hypothetical protein
LPAATLVTPLPFPLALKNGEMLTTVGDAVIYFTHLSGTQRGKHYWQRVIQMFNAAVSEAAYLRTATITLETALLMEGLLAEDG